MPSFSLTSLVALLLLLCCATASSPSAALLWSQAQNPSLSSLSSLASLSTLTQDYSAVVVFSSTNPTHHTASTSLFNQISSAAVSRFLSTEKSVTETVASLLSQVPNVVSMTISTKEELKAFLANDRATDSFLFLQVNLPSDVAEADKWIEEITQVLSVNAKPLSIFTTAPKDTVVTKFAPRALNREARAIPVTDGDLFEVYTFFSPAVYMGIFAGVLILFILIPSLMCLTNLQTPTQFEKAT